jgi:hypothetical protein
VLFADSVAPTLVRFVAPVARALEAQGWETVGVAGGVTGFDRVYDVPPFRRRGLRAHFAAFRTLRQVMALEIPGVAQLHTPAAVALGRLAAASFRVPSISVVHGTFLEPRSRRGALFALAEAPLAWISRRTVVNGDDARFYRRLCRLGSVSQAPAGGAGVDVRPTDSSAQPPPTALYLGRLAADKHLDFLVGAWKEARRQVPDLRLRIVGRTLDGDPPWMPPQIEGIEHVHWTDDPSAEIADATALVTASRREGFPMVVAEAICVGVPVVATTTEVMLVVNIMLLDHAVPSSSVIGAGAFTFIASAGYRGAWRFWQEFQMQTGPSAERAIVFGAGSGGQQVIDALAAGDKRPSTAIGLLDDDPRKRQVRLRHLRVAGGRDAMGPLAERVKATMLTVAVPSATSELIRELSGLVAECGLDLPRAPTGRGSLGRS